MSWRPSCNSIYEHNDNNFVFKLITGVPGGCPGDDKPLQGIYKYKERCETKSHYLEIGSYIWSADIEIISDKLLHAGAFYFFQIHDGRLEGHSPSNLLVRDGEIFLNDINSTGLRFSNNIFNLRCEITIKKDKVKCAYYIDNQFICTTKKSISSKPYVKFGGYRFNALCDVTQIYRNVNLEKL